MQQKTLKKNILNPKGYIDREPIKNFTSAGSGIMKEDEVERLPELKKWMSALKHYLLDMAGPLHTHELAGGITVYTRHA